MTFPGAVLSKGLDESKKQKKFKILLHSSREQFFQKREKSRWQYLFTTFYMSDGIISKTKNVL